ncbi:MAG: 1-phosphofructokinase family hexose kinase [Syntrophorhabdaceae bacterium]|nr:1-phosphofructokinase family hexose kinase [Syntrophorhabdaceae bacterium]
MIYTITLNPILDITMDVEELVYDDVNKVVDEAKRPSGKGIDISRVIKELGGEATVLGFIGGYRGLELESMLINEGIICDFIRINSETRSNIIIHQKKKRLKTLISTPDPELSPVDLSLFLEKIRTIQQGNYAIISSGYPMGLKDSLFPQIITYLNERGVKVILDADSDVLNKSIKAHPYMIKPNIHEFSRLVNKQIKEVEEIIESAIPLLDSVELIVVSMGQKGAVTITKEGAIHAIPPPVKVRNSMGAGDSLVAGMVFMLSRHESIEETISLGVACGTASTLNHAYSLVTKKDVEEIKKFVTIKKF